MGSLVVPHFFQHQTSMTSDARVTALRSYGAAAPPDPSGPSLWESVRVVDVLPGLVLDRRRMPSTRTPGFEVLHVRVPGPALARWIAGTTSVRSP